MATAFSTANMKAEFPNIRLACSQLIEVLKTVGPDEVVDMDNALCRESLDVIGERPCYPSFSSKACCESTIPRLTCNSLCCTNHRYRPGNAGRVGFGKDMGATRSLRDTDHSGQAMEATAGALLEADRRMTDPPRRFKIWRKVPSWMPVPLLPLCAWLPNSVSVLHMPSSIPYVAWLHPIKYTCSIGCAFCSPQLMRSQFLPAAGRARWHRSDKALPQHHATAGGWHAQGAPCKIQHCRPPPGHQGPQDWYLSPLHSLSWQEDIHLKALQAVQHPDRNLSLALHIVSCAWCAAFRKAPGRQVPAARGVNTLHGRL